MFQVKIWKKKIKFSLNWTPLTRKWKSHTPYFSCFFKKENKKFIYSTGENIHPKNWDAKIKFPILNGKDKSKFAETIKLLPFLPIGPSNVSMVPFESENRKSVIKKYSTDADLTLIGFTTEMPFILRRKQRTN